MVGYHFWYDDNEPVVGYQSSCACDDFVKPPEARTWESFADEFNIQEPEVRKQMWQRFRAGKPLHEFDTDTSPFIPIHNADDWQLITTQVTKDKLHIVWVYIMKSNDGCWIKTITQRRNIDGSVCYDERSIYVSGGQL